jgi:hypothetical protein
MNGEIEFLWIGWCQDGTSDKIWTAFKAGEVYYAGWGRRGKAIRFKAHSDRLSLIKVKQQKQKKYDEVDAFLLFSIFPYFEDEVSKKLMMSILTETVM